MLKEIVTFKLLKFLISDFTTVFSSTNNVKVSCNLPFQSHFNDLVRQPPKFKNHKMILVTS